MITPREAILTVLRGVLGVSAPSSTPAPATQRITWETVQVVSRTGMHTVLGSTVPVTGLRIFSVGDHVPVAWRDGAPVAIIGHRWRRAQFHPSVRRVSKGIVEELRVSNLDKTKAEVWYRSHDKMQKIVTRPSLDEHSPVAVKWGLDGCSFGLECTGGLFAVFTFDRPDPNVLDDTFPGPATLLWSGSPLASTTPLVTVTFQNVLTKTVREWIGKLVTTFSYLAAQFADTGVWYYMAYQNATEQDWGGELSASGTAVSSATRSFPLRDVLAGSLVDYAGRTDGCAGEVTDWYVDAVTRHLVLILTARWDDFSIGSSAEGKGSLAWPMMVWTDPNTGERKWGSQVETLTAGGSDGVIGAKKALDHTTVDEQHVFLFDAATQAILWSTAAQTVSQGTHALTFAERMLEHVVSADPGFDEEDLPEPNRGLSRGPSSTDSYYAGANSSSALVAVTLDAGIVGDTRTEQTSSTGTYQLFDPARLAALSGPYGAVTSGYYTGSDKLYGLWSAVYSVTYATRSGGFQRNWHYRVASVRAFSTRVNVGTTEHPRYVDAPRFFLVLERYGFVAGTNYVRDLPMVWVGVIDATGAVVRTLRDWQYGLSAEETELVTANGHRIVWTLGVGALWSLQTLYVTNLVTGVEVAFSPAQAAKFAASFPRLYPPDFAWDQTAPETFYAPADVQTLTVDTDLAELAPLVPSDGTNTGSVRIINDADTLTPLNRYTAT